MTEQEMVLTEDDDKIITVEEANNKLEKISKMKRDLDDMVNMYSASKRHKDSKRKLPSPTLSKDKKKARKKAKASRKANRKK